MELKGGTLKTEKLILEHVAPRSHWSQEFSKIEWEIVYLFSYWEYAEVL